MTDEELLELGLGDRIRALREARGLDRPGAAELAGLASEGLVDFEEGRRVPALAELIRLSGVLGVSLDHFFQRAVPERRIEVVRSHERWTLEPPTETGRTLNYRYQSLSYNLTDKLMSPFLVEIPPGDVAASPSQHEGEEFLFVLAGHLEVRVGGEAHRLEPGDAIYFDSQLQHELRALEGATVRLVACVAQGVRSAEDEAMRRAFSRGTA